MSKPKRLEHISGHKYRICRKCGYEYNVSIFDTSGRVYICTKCERKRRKKPMNDLFTELDKLTDNTSDYEVEEFKE